MHVDSGPKINKWPFLFGDVLLLGVATVFCWKAAHPLEAGMMALVILCVAAGAVLSLAPFVLEFRAQAKIAEAGILTKALERIQNLENIAKQIGDATAQWQDIHGNAEKASNAARQIGERMTAEVKGFSEFLDRVNDREKSMLRVEVEKLRRAEGDWVQVLVRMLDHVYALHLGALRSSQPALIEQVGNFQNACRDAARIVGLTPFAPQRAEPFDQQRHQLVDDSSKPGPEARVAETIASGYTYQGKLLRPALVRLTNGDGEPVVRAH